MPIKEFHVDKILLEMGLSMDEFIDLCILLGCDYCDSIRGIGPKRAVDLIKQHKNIETILKHLDTKKYTIPEDWPYEQARALFKNPEVTDPKDVDLKWTEPDESGLVKYMVEEKGFSEERIRNGYKKLTKAKNTSTQGRLDSFFKVTSITPAAKRKDADQKGGAKKKSKAGGGFKRGK